MYYEEPPYGPFEVAEDTFSYIIEVATEAIDYANYYIEEAENDIASNMSMEHKDDLTEKIGRAHV